MEKNADVISVVVSPDEIRQMAGHRSGSKARIKFARRVAALENIDDANELMQRCRELAGIAPGRDAAFSIVNSRQAKVAANVAATAVNATELDDLRKLVGLLSEQVSRLTTVSEALLDAVTRPKRDSSTEQI